MQFIIIHWSYWSAQGNWFPQLRQKLELVWQEVFVPQFPVDDRDDITKQGQNASVKQSLSSWMEAFESQVLPHIDRTQKLCFVWHSLGNVFILHLIEKYWFLCDCVIFVSPFLSKLEGAPRQIDLVNQTFHKSDFDFDIIRKQIDVSYTLYTDNDPYVPSKHSSLFAKALDSSMIQVKKWGHLNSEVNLNEFPLVYDLCCSRLDLSLYQKFIAYSHDLNAISFVKSHPGILSITWKDIITEGVFKFRNLQRSGFCTFLTSIELWDTASVYMSEARQAAQRIKDFTRVFIIADPRDLDKPSLLEQIKLDKQAGIQVYLCNLEDIQGKVEELDFGIWDDEYICMVHEIESSGTKNSEVILNSLPEKVQQGQARKETILRFSHPYWE